MLPRCQLNKITLFLVLVNCCHCSDVLRLSMFGFKMGPIKHCIYVEEMRLEHLVTQSYICKEYDQ